MGAKGVLIFFIQLIYIQIVFCQVPFTGRCAGPNRAATQNLGINSLALANAGLLANNGLTLANGLPIANYGQSNAGAPLAHSRYLQINALQSPAGTGCGCNRNNPQIANNLPANGLPVSNAMPIPNVQIVNNLPPGTIPVARNLPIINNPVPVNNVLQSYNVPITSNAQIVYQNGLPISTPLPTTPTPNGSCNCGQTRLASNAVNSITSAAITNAVALANNLVNLPVNSLVSNGQPVLANNFANVPVNSLAGLPIGNTGKQQIIINNPQLPVTQVTNQPRIASNVVSLNYPLATKTNVVWNGEQKLLAKNAAAMPVNYLVSQPLQNIVWNAGQLTNNAATMPVNYLAGQPTPKATWSGGQAVWSKNNGQLTVPVVSMNSLASLPAVNGMPVIKITETVYKV